MHELRMTGKYAGFTVTVLHGLQFRILINRMVAMHAGVCVNIQHEARNQII